MPPGAGRSLVLITSRSMLAGLEVDERIGLDVLTEEEADALLAGLIGEQRAAAEPHAVARGGGSGAGGCRWRCGSPGSCWPRTRPGQWPGWPGCWLTSGTGWHD